MPKSKKVTQKTEPAEDTQKLNARATPRVWPSRSARRALAARQRRARSLGQKADPSFAQSLRRLIIPSGWDGADRRSSSGSPSPLRSPAACRCAVNDNRASRQPALNGHRSSRAYCRGSSTFKIATSLTRACNFLHPTKQRRNVLIREQTATSLYKERTAGSSAPPRQLKSVHFDPNLPSLCHAAS